MKWGFVLNKSETFSNSCIEGVLSTLKKSIYDVNILRALLNGLLDTKQSGIWNLSWKVKAVWTWELVSILSFFVTPFIFCLYRLFHLPTLRCQSPSQCPAITVWYTATLSAHWETPTFCHWPTLLCRGIVCLLV